MKGLETERTQGRKRRLDALMHEKMMTTLIVMVKKNVARRIAARTPTGGTESGAAWQERYKNRHFQAHLTTKSQTCGYTRHVAGEEGPPGSIKNTRAVLSRIGRQK